MSLGGRLAAPAILAMMTAFGDPLPEAAPAAPQPVDPDELLADIAAMIAEAQEQQVITAAEERALLDREKVLANREAANAALEELDRRLSASIGWPEVVRGPLRRGPNGLVFPQRVATTEEARAILAQIEATAELRELTPREGRARRRLRQAQGIRRPLSEKEETTLQRAELKRRSKAAKRARASQAMMASARGQVVAAALRELATAGGDA